MILSYDNYLDKVYGAWLGKSISGTIGAPFEGRKELFDYSYDVKALKEMLPNDDLDLQVIWLHALEEKGIHLTSVDLAEAFYSLYPFVPGEYAYFKKNYARGIMPPLSGAFNNRYYINGMGCPIRSEIWACICPGNPELAAEYAGKDGVLDHAGDSVHAERFWAAMEAAAFFENDLGTLIRTGMKYLPQTSKIERLVKHTLQWSQTEPDWRVVRSWILRDYGHPDCTNLYQNIGFTLLALLYGHNDFLETTMIALNCGFDTDCSCATAGALLGIISGAHHLIETYQFYDTSYKLDARVKRRSNLLKDLAEDTCRIGLTVASELNREIEIADAPQLTPVSAGRPAPAVRLAVDYEGDPVIGWNESKMLSLLVTNGTEASVDGKIAIKVPAGWNLEISETEVAIPAGQSARIGLRLCIPDTVEQMCEKNILRAEFAGASLEFGLNGAQVWKVFGPFWENYAEVPRTELGEFYYSHIKGETPDRTADLVRQYHLNTKVQPDYPYIADIGRIGLRQDYVVANIKEDLFELSDLIGFQGPCVVYAIRRIRLDEEREVNLLIGHSDAYTLWLNGEKISEVEHADWWTAENRHLSSIHLPKGDSEIVLKCVRRSRLAEFSLIFTETGSFFPHHIPDLVSVIEPRANHD
ncbi:ADP-ribosylglycohydrolase family protein [Paenibacillus nasutitermitis]|uniref:ADP-ribosylglycohydrolase family protein n=1 Tax=Paenibacillus nasutitermitis TaxID=1652958 RepID=A0A916ZCN4_9BACL|nr:ADP-ribosylglycohydrolase family protein [Paenibacillus nasutitermitis]GGD88936.1 hypothetical protein GCM10010911_54400 [Paenibacillus nasutitermitis]